LKDVPSLSELPNARFSKRDKPDAGVRAAAEKGLN
jgi:hypothetical protein